MTDEADFYHGMPIGLQIVARRFEDEKLLGIAKFLCDQLQRPAIP